jgi:replicative DNA helicase
VSISRSSAPAIPIYIDDTAGSNLMDIHAKLRRLHAEAGLGLVVIDYLQLMSSRGRSENRNQEVSAISRGLKLLAKELRVPFIVLSQLSRAPETRPGDDLVGFIYREEVYNRDREDLKGLAKLIIAKQRNGPIGDVNLVFLKEFTKFENPLTDLDDDAPPE